MASEIIDEAFKKPHQRLKKSFSECEYYENTNCPTTVSGIEINFNKSSPKRKYKEAPEDLHQPCYKQKSINDTAHVEQRYESDETGKIQYLLHQQQKLREYQRSNIKNMDYQNKECAYKPNSQFKNDPIFVNSDNYSSESSTETKGILKNNTKLMKTTTNTEPRHKNSLKRNQGLSTLSLCSCDAETEVTMKRFLFILMLSFHILQLIILNIVYDKYSWLIS